MHGDQALATDYDDPMCTRLLGRPPTYSGLSEAPLADGI